MPETLNCPDCAGPSQSPPMIYNTATYVQGTSTIRCMQCVRTWDVGLFHERFVGPGTVNPPKPEPSVPLSHGTDLEAAMDAGPHPRDSVSCDYPGCTRGKFFTSRESLPDHWLCHEHEPARLKPGQHPQTVLPCAMAGCTRGHSFDVADQIPLYWYCEDHRCAVKPDPENAVQEAVLELREALEEINPFLKALHAGDTIEMARTLGIINRAREKYPLKG